jgi:hypothetical protein
MLLEKYQIFSVINKRAEPFILDGFLGAMLGRQRSEITGKSLIISMDVYERKLLSFKSWNWDA